MRKTVFLLFLFLTFNISAQRNGNIFVADINGNGKRDRIVRSVYKKSVLLPSYTEENKCVEKNGHFAKFVWFPDKRKNGIKIFDYFIGDDEAQYWQYRIDKTVDLNKDGVKDLIFYAGDDTTEEYVFLIQKRTHFKAVYSGTLDLSEFIDLSRKNNLISKENQNSPKLVAKWNPKREVFEGRNIKWITKDCVGMYAAPNNKSALLNLFTEGEIFEISNKRSDRKNGWQKVSFQTAEGLSEGWIDIRYLSNTSPTKIFPKS